MAWMFQLQLNVPSYRRGTVLGEGHVPITIINLGFGCLVQISLAHMSILNEIVKSGRSPSNYLTEHCDQLRLHKKRVTARARKQAQMELSGQIEYHQSWSERHRARADELATTNHELKQALRTLVEFRNAEPGLTIEEGKTE